AGNWRREAHRSPGFLARGYRLRERPGCALLVMISPTRSNLQNFLVKPRALRNITVNCLHYPAKASRGRSPGAPFGRPVLLRAFSTAPTVPMCLVKACRASQDTCTLPKEVAAREPAGVSARLILAGPGRFRRGGRVADCIGLENRQRG